MDLKQGFSKQITKLNIKTSSFLEETKIKTYISTLEGDIKELKAKVGELGYALWSENRFDQEELRILFEEIDEKYRLIREQETLLTELEEKNRQVLGGAPTSPAPAAPAPAAPAADGEVAAQSMIFCPNCGEKYPVGVNFCKKCGSKLN